MTTATSQHTRIGDLDDCPLCLDGEHDLESSGECPCCKQDVDMRCDICGLDPCDCDAIHDNWRERDL